MFLKFRYFGKNKFCEYLGMLLYSKVTSPKHIFVKAPSSATALNRRAPAARAAAAWRHERPRSLELMLITVCALQGNPFCLLVFPLTCRDVTFFPDAFRLHV